MFVVVAYDIADNKRRVRVMKALQGFGEHVQESVFECHVDDAVYRKMVRRLKELVNQGEDNVRLYHLCQTDVARIQQLGVGRAAQMLTEFAIV